MKLKEVLNEMLVDKDVIYKNVFGNKSKFDIYENPTPEQLKEAGPDARAVKTINGKIYIVSDQDTNGIIHEDLVNILSKNGYITSKYNDNWWKEPESLNHYVCIIRDKGRWVISESYNFRMNFKEFKEEVLEKYPGIKVEHDEQ